MPDHVHMLVGIPPKMSVPSFMGYLKGKSSLMVFERHGNLKYRFGNRKFWAEGYYVSTVGLNEAMISKYIREQEAHDQALDKLSVKEREGGKGGALRRRPLLPGVIPLEQTTRYAGGHDWKPVHLRRNLCRGYGENRSGP